MQSTATQATSGVPESSSSTAQPQPRNEMQGAFFLYIVIPKAPAILKLLAREYEPLLVWGYSFLIAYFAIDHIYRIRGFDVNGNGFTCQGTKICIVVGS